ncbi:MAG TPA: hypothetical protein VN908_08270 [Gemmatimonadales bacterium]|nr:hypothetical protein [Gemmatimonadales bacterium]
MFRKTLLMLALVAAPTIAEAQQPMQQPTPPPHRTRTNAQRADTSKAKARRARRSRKARTTAPRDTTKSKP